MASDYTITVRTLADVSTASCSCGAARPAPSSTDQAQRWAAFHGAWHETHPNRTL